MSIENQCWIGLSFEENLVLTPLKKFVGSWGAGLSLVLQMTKPHDIGFGTFFQFKNLQAWFRNQFQFHIH